MSSTTVPPILASLVGRIALAVPARARTTFLELLLGAAATRSGHVTDAILSSGVSRCWTTYFLFLERGRWSWLQVWGAPGLGAQFRLTLPVTAGAELTSSPLPLRPVIVRRPGGPS